jgi:threonine synthase
MTYISTRDTSVRVSSARAIAQGISKESGLFVPEALPQISAEALAGMLDKSYIERAKAVLSGFLTDFTAAELDSCLTGAYDSGAFPGNVAPLTELGGGAYLLELWHGPTCAFKDMALQLLPYLLTVSAKKEAAGKDIVILVATSGDTGKAALEGFRDVPGTRILVFYPQDGVSAVQKLQMATQQGGNVAVMGVYGNFDDTQTGVKRIFTDPELAARLDSKNMMFSSANSINWGRLVPQIAYYFSAYCDLVKSGGGLMGERVNICVPTGNFGNILAAWYAKGMGLPVGKLICASNINKVLTDFISTGTYDRRRELILTSSPSMDILISSNLERLLFGLSGGDDALIAALMAELGEKGIYTVPEGMKARLQDEFWAGFADEGEVAATVRETFREKSYLMDTHTAVGVNVYNKYVAETGDRTKTIIASTANPYKFSGAILEAVTGEASAADEFAQIEALEKATRTTAPQSIKRLKELPVRFGESCTKDGMKAAVESMLGL